MAEGTTREARPVSRRGFLKTAAAVAGATAAVGSGSVLTQLAAADANGGGEVEEYTQRAACRGNCGSRCALRATVRDGKVVKSTVFEEYPEDQYDRRRACVKGFTHPQRIYDPDRLKYPLRRVGERGAGEWERISWDEAAEEVAQHLTDAIENYGGPSVGFWSSYGSYGMLNGAMGGYRSVAYGRFITNYGCTVLGAGADTSQQHLQSTLLGVSGNDFRDAANAKTIVSWGGNPAEAYVHAWHWICDAREKGAQLITVDPQFTASAMHSDLYVPVKPGTDGAMMLAMANYIVQNELEDRDFLRSSTCAPYLVKDDGTYLRMSDLGVEPQEGPADAYGQPTTIDPVVVWDEEAEAYCELDEAQTPAIWGSYKVDGTRYKTCLQTVMDNIADYTLEKAEAICDVPAATIERLALAYATEGPVYTMTFQGLGHHVNSRHNYKDLALLHALTGNAGKSGASICGAPSCGMYSVNYTPMMLGSAGPSLCGMWLPRLMEDKQWAGTDIDLQVLWMHNGNMLSCESGRQELIEAVKKVPYVVHVGDMLNDSSEWADIVLPIPHSFEIEDFDCVCSAPYPTYYAKVIDPLYDCKSDLSIMRLVTEKMGVDLYPMTDEEFLHAIIDTDANLAAGGGYDDFKAGTFVWNYNYTEASQIKQYGSAESSRLKFYLENPYPRNNWGQDVADYERYPYYEHANEAYDENPLIEKYPLMGCSQHDKYHVHSQLAHTPVMREIDPEPVLKINAADAAERGIEQGDYVRAYNDHGSVVIKALVTEGIRPGVVSIPHGWQAGQFVEGHAQDLTNVFMNDFDANSAFYDFLCEVERCEGGAA